MTTLQFMPHTWESVDRFVDEYEQDSKEHRAYIFGNNADGKSVCLEVKNCYYEFYIKVYKNSKAWGTKVIKTIKNKISDQLVYLSKEIPIIKLVEKEIAYGYLPDPNHRFIYMRINSSRAFYTMKKYFKEELKGIRIDTYNQKLSPILSLMHRENFSASGWIEIPFKKLKPLEEVRVDYPYSLEDSKYITKMDYDLIPPLKILSWDIEVYSASGEFPEAHKKEDSVIQIGYSTMKYGTDEPLKKKVLVVGECPPSKDKDTEIECFNTEKELLVAWVSEIKKINPDIMTGYNIFGFDWNYIKIRTELLKCKRPYTRMSRLDFVPSKFTKSMMESAAYGQNIFDLYEIPGITQLDLLHYFRREEKLDSYKLDNVAGIFLGSKKNDVSPQQIFAWGGPKGTPKQRLKVADYCAQDTVLPLQLINKRVILQNLVEMSKLAYVPLYWLVSRGQQIKAYSQIMKILREKGMVFPDNPIVEDFGKFEGATVLTCSRGLHKEEVATLDFASLYPTIMIAHNLCFTTMIIGKDTNHIPDGTYDVHEWDTEDGIHKKHCFAKDTVKKGIIPGILTHLGAERKRVKKEMKKANGVMKTILNSKQLAIKVTMNSIYGVLGSNTGYMPAKAIAETVTRNGRMMIEHTKNLAEKMYDGSEKCNYIKTKVVYGDSVTPQTPIMIKKDGKIDFIEIQELAETNWKSYNNFKPFCLGRTNKQKSTSKAKVWDGHNWTSIKKVIRHKVNKKIYKVITKTGYVEVTEDHSLISENGEYIKPHDIKIGSKLFSSYPPDIVSSNKKELYYNMEYFTQLGAAKAFKRHYSPGTSIKYINNRFIVISKNNTIIKNPGEIIRIEETDLKPEFVYDIETESGHFQAGVGTIIVKNTDSVFVKFFLPNSKNMTQEERIKMVGEHAEKAADYISSTFKKPILLEFENIYVNLLMLTKKRYAMHCFEPNGDGTYDNQGLKVKGLQVVKRDTIPFTKDVLTKLLNNIIIDGDVDKGTRMVKREIKKLMDGKIPLPKLYMSKALKSKYKLVPAHAQLAERMNKIDPLGAPKPGDRIQYVFVDNVDYKNAKVGDRIEHPDYLDGKKIDYLFYLDRQVKKPIIALLACIIKDENGNIYPLNQKGEVPRECEKMIEKLWEPLVEKTRKEKEQAWIIEKRKRKNEANKQRHIQEFFKKSP